MALVSAATAEFVRPRGEARTKPRILVIDDSRVQRDLVCTSLNTHYQVEFAVDGIDGLSQIAREAPDAIILDIMMPNMDGFEVCQRLRADPATAHIPILMATACTDLEAISHAFDVGATDFVTKPISPVLLPYRIRYLLKTSKVEAALRETQAEAVAAYQQVSDLSRTLEERVSAQRMELEATQSSLLEAERRLRHSSKMEALGMLAGGIAHEFNNQLTVIGGFARAAASKVDDAGRVEDCLREITVASDRAANLTGQMLTFSRTQVVSAQTVNVVELVAGLRPVLRTSAGADMELRMESEVEEAHADLDPDQLCQAILNLAVNARDAMPAGGSLTVRVEVRDLVSGTKLSHHGEYIVPGPYVRIRVCDTGCGMDRATLERVFDPFFTTKEVGKGTGLGLSVVFGFVQQAGGMVDIKSAPGEGAEFSLYFPLVDQTDVSEAAESAEALPGQGETILVVEDEGAVLGLVKITLEDLGYRVLGADNGAAAIEVVQERQSDIDLLITDVVMPRIGGIELAKRFAEACPGKGIIYMSGYSPLLNDHLKDIDHSYGFLKKPFQPSELAHAVRDALDSQVE